VNTNSSRLFIFIHCPARRTPGIQRAVGTAVTAPFIATERCIMKLDLIVLAVMAGPFSAGIFPAGAQNAVTTTIVANLGNGGHDAANPEAGPLVLGAGKTLFGTAAQGGVNQLGAVFSVTPAGTEAVVHSFNGTTDGVRPGWGLTRDAAGNLYGASNAAGGSKGFVFKLGKNGSFKILHSFAANGSEGELIDNGVTLGKDGLLYGFAGGGGIANSGTFYRLATDGTQFTIIYNFGGTNDGGGTGPGAVPTQGPDGAFYGLTTSASQSNGTPLPWSVVRVTSAGAASFILGLPDANESPRGAVAIDAAGNLYAIAGARNGGQTGRIYQFTPGGAINVLHQFVFAEGLPESDNQCLSLAKDGRLYGTTNDGGANGTSNSDGIGTVFGLNTDGSGFAVLHNFGTGANDGLNPWACPAQAADGSLWGTTNSGGLYNGGTVYKLAKPTVKLSLVPSTVTLGKSVKLTWSSTETTACTISGPGVSQSGTAGTISFMPAASGSFTYAARCSGAGSALKAMKLTVN